MPVTAAQLIGMAETFDWKTWSAKWGAVVTQHERHVVQIAGDAAAGSVGGEFNFDDPFVETFLRDYVTERVTSLDATTRADVAKVLRASLAGADGQTPFDLGTTISDAIAEKFDDWSRWRADRIARTETAIAYNHGSVLGFHQAGATRVVVSDGDDDAECAAVDGQIWSIDSALANPVAHPNCTRAFSPYVDDAVGAEG